MCRAASSLPLVLYTMISSRFGDDTLYLENEIDQYLEVTNYEQICGFIVGNPIYNYFQKIKKNLNSLLLN